MHPIRWGTQAERPLACFHGGAGEIEEPFYGPALRGSPIATWLFQFDGILLYHPASRVGLESTKEFRNLRTKDLLAWFSAGLGVGIAASVLFAPVTGSQARGRIRGIAGRTGDFFTARAEHLGEAARDVLDEINPSLKDEFNERSHTMSDLKDKAKEKIGDAAEAAKKATAQAADKAKGLTHKAGKKIEEGGKRLQNA